MSVKYGPTRKTTRVPRGHDQAAADSMRKYDAAAKSVGDAAVAKHRERQPFANYDAMTKRVGDAAESNWRGRLGLRRRGS